jgi:hypothetical protein
VGWRSSLTEATETYTTLVTRLPATTGQKPVTVKPNPDLAELEKADGQRLAHMAGLNPDGRFEITDPRKTPPSKYWPR